MRRGLWYVDPAGRAQAPVARSGQPARGGIIISFDGFNYDPLNDFAMVQRMLTNAETRVRASMAARGGG